MTYDREKAVGEWLLIAAVFTEAVMIVAIIVT
jgi:hypothetical protein